jgi:hypothetical protein
VDDLDVDAAGGGVFDDGVLVAGVGPGSGDAGVVGGDVVQDVGAGGGVVDGGGCNQDGEEEAEGVGDDVAFVSRDPFGGVEALVGEVDVGGGLDGLRVEEAGAGAGVASFVFADESAQESGELVEDE